MVYEMLAAKFVFCKDRCGRQDGCGSLRRITTGLFALIFLTVLLVVPAAAAQPPNSQFNSTDAMLRWINAYRHKPDPEALPAVVRALSTLQAFKDAETSGAYIGFIAGVLGANPARAEVLIAEMLPIRSGRSLGAGARHRLFGPAELEGVAGGLSSTAW